MGPGAYLRLFPSYFNFIFKILKSVGLSLIQCITNIFHILGNSNFDQFWTAGNDLQTENVFVWDGMNDSINEYTDWAPNEPNQNGGNEDCIAFFPFVNYHWNDEHCDKRENYICEQL